MIGDVDGDGDRDKIREPIDHRGEFWFVNLWPGRYVVREVTEDLPHQAIMPSTDSQTVVDVFSMEEHVWKYGAAMLPPDAPQMEVLDESLIFGNVVKGSIHGFKFEDVDGDGEYEPDDEKHPEGPFDPEKFPIEFELEGDVDGDGIVETVRETIDETGQFWFEKLWPGEYIVREVTDNLPDDIMPSTHTETTVFVHSMIELVWEFGAAMLEPDDPLRMEELEPSLIFGNVVKGSIHGFKFHDVNGDGVYDPDVWDAPFDPDDFPVEFELRGDIDGDGDEDWLREKIDHFGQFWFVDFWPGDYSVREVIEDLPPDIVPTTFTQTSVLFVGSMQELVWKYGAAMLEPDDPQVEVLNESLIFGNRFIHDGCTPGYWKNNAEHKEAVAWDPTGVDPSDPLSSVGFSGFSAQDGDNTTFLDALNAEGGGENALMRYTAAAYLNASHPDINYGLTTNKIVDAVNDALAIGNPGIIEATKDMLDDFNNFGCNIDQFGRNSKEELLEVQALIASSNSASLEGTRTSKELLFAALSMSTVDSPRTVKSTPDGAVDEALEELTPIRTTKLRALAGALGSSSSDPDLGDGVREPSRTLKNGSSDFAELDAVDNDLLSLLAEDQAG